MMSCVSEALLRRIVSTAFLKLDLEVLRFCCSCVELHLEGAILLLQVDHHATNGLEVIISPSELIS